MSATELNWDDEIEVLHRVGNGVERVARPFSEIKERMNNNPDYGMKEVTVDQEFVLDGFFVEALTVPAGAVLKYIALNIIETAVAGGTTVKVGLGINDGDVDKYGITANLTVNSKITNPIDYNKLAADETIDITGVTSDGSALGDTEFSAGKVRVVAIYEQPVALGSV